MAFHRFAVPSYTGGLPGGYDYLNNALTGTPAIYDGPRASGPNAGTYFVGFGEDGRSFTVNRGLKALADNTDFLDDLLRRDLAVPTRTADVLAGAPVVSITLTGPVFLGAAGTPNTVDGINTFIQITDEDDNEIVDATLSPCLVTAIAGGSVGSGGFSAGDVVLTISPAIPTGTTYRVYYGTLANLATLPVDALTNIRIRGAQEVPADLLAAGGADLIGYNGGGGWQDGSTNPGPTTVGAQLDKIIADLSAIGVGDNGADRIGAVGYSGTYFSTLLSSVGGLLNEISFGLDTLIGDLVRARTITANATLHSPAMDSLIVLNPAPASGFNLQLPDPAGGPWYKVFLFNGNGNMNSVDTIVTLVRNGGEKINGLTSNYSLDTSYGRWILLTDGTDWYVF